MSELQPWQRPPFEPGNETARKHGAHSSTIVEPRARAVLAALEAEAPVWLHAVDRAALEAWARAEARCGILRDWVDERGLLDPKGKPTGAAELLLRCERQAADLRGRLGLDPLARARLGRDTAVAQAAAAGALDQIRATGAQTRAGRERTQEDA